MVTQSSGGVEHTFILRLDLANILDARLELCLCLLQLSERVGEVVQLLQGNQRCRGCIALYRLPLLAGAARQTAVGG